MTLILKIYGNAREKLIHPNEKLNGIRLLTPELIFLSISIQKVIAQTKLNRKQLF